jgi:oxaloacetate decarboxylase (Na+ extruding) subunit alpha
MYGDEKIDGLAPTATGDNFSVHHPIVDLVAGLAKRQSKARMQISGDGFSLSAN